MVYKYYYYKPEITQLDDSKADFPDFKACDSSAIPHYLHGTSRSGHHKSLKVKLLTINDISACFLKENMYSKDSQ